MSYGQFLVQWYNLAFLTAAGAGLLCVAVGRLTGRDLVVPAAALLGAAVIGLTWNGALHDLGLGSPAPRFPLIALASSALGIALGHWVARMRDRHFRPIRAVEFNRPGHEGVQARIVTRMAGPQPGSGRAQWQDAAGVLHVVHVHTEGPRLRFGTRIELGPFDVSGGSYLAVPCSRRRPRSRTREEGDTPPPM